MKLPSLPPKICAQSWPTFTAASAANSFAMEISNVAPTIDAGPDHSAVEGDLEVDAVHGHDPPVGDPQPVHTEERSSHAAPM